MVSGIILSGGRSQRMGSTKALLQFNGKFLIQYPIDLLKSLCSEVVIVTQTPESYGGFNVQIVPDEYKEAGPMGGIYSGLAKTTNHWTIVLACDMPCVRRELLQGMIKQIADKTSVKAVIPLVPGSDSDSGGLIKQPLCALYSKDCSDFLKQKIGLGQLSLVDSLTGPSIITIHWLKLDPEDPQAISFRNLNTPQDLLKAKNIRFDS